MGTSNIHLFEKNEFFIYVTANAEKEIEEIRDRKHRKRIVQFMYRLSMRIPNKPELWEKIKGCGENVFELKPRPYRLGCYVEGRYILIVHVWRVQKGRSTNKSANIKKACEIAREVKDEFKRFIGNL